MQYHKQLCKHDPENGSYGDCVRTCIANLLDLHPSNVPHFFDNDVNGDDAWNHIEEYLNKVHGLMPFIMSMECEPDVIRQYMKINRPDAYYILLAEGSEGCGHAVVCLGDEIVSDPSWTNSSIVCSHHGLSSFVLLIPMRFINA